MSEHLEVMPTEMSRRNISTAVYYAQKRVPSGVGETTIELPLEVHFTTPQTRNRSVVLPTGTRVIFGSNSEATVVFRSDEVRLNGSRGPFSKVSVSCFENWRVIITID